MSLRDKDFVDLFAPLAQEGAGETVAFVYFDSEGQLLGLRHCPSASFVSIEVPLRAVVADALAFDAQLVAMAHNHPSHDPEPSEDDLVATRRIPAALDPLGIRLVDHLVLAGDTVTSIRARGLL